MMQGGWMGDGGTSYMSGWGGLGMVLIVSLVVAAFLLAFVSSDRHAAIKRRIANKGALK